MIKILILSDDVFGWAEQIINDLPNTKSRIDINQKSARIWNETFGFQILAGFDPCYVIAERYNSIILDKYINKNDFDNIISKLLLPDSHINKTTRYKIWESCADMLGTEINSMLRLFQEDYKETTNKTLSNVKTE